MSLRVTGPSRVGLQVSEMTEETSAVRRASCFVQNFNTNVPQTSGVPRNFFRGGGSTNSVEDRGQRERGSGGGSPLVRGSEGSCSLVQEISFHIVKFSQFLVL